MINAPSVRWARACDKPQMVRYHDREWGKPVPHYRKHFEMLLLEGAQAGLTWETILWKREGYRKAFDGFDPKTAAWFLFRRSTMVYAYMQAVGLVDDHVTTCFLGDNQFRKRTFL